MNSAKKSPGLLFRLLTAGVVLHTVFSPNLLLATDKKSNLIQCPDCGKDVSRRAVHCPACGCPGEAISAEARIGDARVLKPVVVITAPNGGGFGIAVEDEGKYFDQMIGPSIVNISHRSLPTKPSKLKLAICAHINT